MNIVNHTKLLAAIALAVGLTAVLRASAALNEAPAPPADRQYFDMFRDILPQLRASHPDQYDTAEKLQAAWEHFAETIALAETARALGYAERPDIHYRLEQMLAQELILRDAENAKPIHAITEDEITTHIQSHRAEFERPAMAGIHELVIPLASHPAAARALAHEIRASLTSGPVSLERFLQAAHEDPGTDPPTVNAAYLGLLPVSELTNGPAKLPASALAELLRAAQVGRVGSVQELGQALRIYRLSAYREPVSIDSPAARDAVRRALYLKARRDRINELAAQSQAKLPGRLDEADLPALLAPLAASTQVTDLPPSPAALDVPSPTPAAATPGKDR